MVKKASKTQERAARKAAAGPCSIMHACGGCSWIGVPYKKQLMRKHAAMEELFAPLLAEFGWNITIDPVEGMGVGINTNAAAVSTSNNVASQKITAPRGFRCKVTTPFAPGPNGEVLSGLFAAGTHNIVPVDTCAIEAPGARMILNRLAVLATELNIDAYDEDRRRGQLRYAVVRMGWKTNEALLTLITANRDVPHLDELVSRIMTEFPQLVGVAQNINPRTGNAILGPDTRILAGQNHMRDELLGCVFEISPTAFYQTNPAQTEVLYQCAIDDMELKPGDTLLDAYCGSGTIGLCAASQARNTGTPISLIGVERNPAGISDALVNAHINSFDARGTAFDELTDGFSKIVKDTNTAPTSSVMFIAEDATTYIKQLAVVGTHIDVLCLDPPRAGSTKTFLDAACALEPRRIVYVSCNPETQLRDLKVLGAAGYQLTRLTPVDLFPHTPHIETVAALSKK